MKIYKKKMLVGVILVLVLFLNMFPEKSIQSIKDPYIEKDQYKIDFWNGSLSVSSSPIVGQEFSLEFSVKPIEDVSKGLIKFFIPEEIRITSGETQWKGTLKKNEIHKKSINLLTENQGEWEISVWIENKDYPYFNRAYFGYIISKSDSGEFKISSKITEKKGTKCETELIKNLIHVPSKQEISSQTTVYGYLYYKHDNGNDLPVRYAYAELFEEKFGPDDSIGIGSTNHEGLFSFTIDISNPINVYVKIESNSDAAKVVNTDSDIYEVRCPKSNSIEIYSGISNFIGSYGISQGSESHPWQAMDYVIDEYQWVYNHTQEHFSRSQVEIQFPVGEKSGCYGNIIYLPDKTVKPWWEKNVYHEYGHCIQFYLYGDNWPGDGNPGSHVIYGEHIGRCPQIVLGEEDFALMEGWAEFMENIMCNYKLYFLVAYKSPSAENTATLICENQKFTVEWEHPNPSDIDDKTIENNNWWMGEDYDGSNNSGSIVEGAIASIFWDIYDGIDDDNLSMGFNSIFNIMKNNKPNTIHEFWNAWNLGYKQELWEIYYDHGINKDTSPPTISNVQISPSSPTSSQSVHVYANIADDLSGLTKIECWWTGQQSPPYVWAPIEMIQYSGNTYKTSTPIPPHTAGKIIHYYIIAQDNANNSIQSSTYQYTVESEPVNPPLAPSGLYAGPTYTKTSIELHWNDNSNDETGFKIYVDGNYYESVSENSTSRIVSGLTCGTTYEFYITAYNANGESAPSNTVSTSTSSCGDAPAPPTLISPSNGSTTDDDTPVFSWNTSSGADSYGLQVAQDAGFTTLVIDTTTSSTSYTPTTSLADGEYYWRVNASNSHGTSNWSVVWNFTIDVPINEPPTVTVLSPNGNEIFPSGSQVEITWEATDAEDGENLSVNLYYSTDGGSSFPLIISTLEENDGHHTWNIPEISCSTCRILVQVTDSGGLSNDDMSDADFSILEPPDSIDLVQSWGMAAVVGDQYGLAWDESDLWSIVIGKTIYKHDPTDITSILDYSAVPGNGEGLAWDGVNMWVTGTNTLFKLNGTDGSDYEEIIPSEYTTRFAGLTWRDGYIWVLNHNMTIAEIRKIDPNTGIVLEKYTIDIGSSITNASSLEWDPYRGVFWLGLHESNQIYMLNGNNPGEVLQIYTVEGITGADGLALAYDGEILWVSSVDGAYLYKLTFTPNIRFNNAVYPSQKDFFNLRIGNDNIIVDEKMRSTFKFSNLKDFFSFFYINYGIV